MIPQKLKRGDRVAVVAPARSLSIINQTTRKIAILHLKKLGLSVEFGQHVDECDDFASSSISSRLEDLSWAFENKQIKGILTVIGGFNSNQLLRYLNYKVIKSNPKILCGYSDITALSNAVYAKTGMVTYSGPHFSSFGMKLGIGYTSEYFEKCLMSSKPFEVSPSKEWSDDMWYSNQGKRRFIKNSGYEVINEGEAEGTIIGGNLCTFNLLQGTEFMPSIKNSIVFLEDDKETRPHTFDRDLQSLIHQPNFDSVKALVIGRFQKASVVRQDLLNKIIRTKKELDNIPVISGVDFGHTTPQMTFPVGGTVRLTAEKKETKLEILNH